MLHYILGHSGVGKTEYCLKHFSNIPNSIFFYFDPDSELKFPHKIASTELIKIKCIIDCLPFYRENLETRGKFSQQIYLKTKEAIEKNFEAIFLDEFQLYYGPSLIDLIVKNKNRIDFYVIHQFPEQLEAKYFKMIYPHADKKYLLDPYTPSDYYSL